jgi:hemerythrin
MEEYMQEKPFIEWDDKFSVGIRAIDDQHKELVRLTNELYQGCLAGDDTAKAYFLVAIHSTVAYVKYHFSSEEKLMKKVNYPQLGEHKREHDAFTKEIIEGAKNFEEGKKFVPNLFVRYLKDWVLSHIAVSDIQYARYIMDLKKKGLLEALLKK